MLIVCFKLLHKLRMNPKIKLTKSTQFFVTAQKSTRLCTKVDPILIAIPPCTTIRHLIKLWWPSICHRLYIVHVLHRTCPSHDNFMSVNIYHHIVLVLATCTLSIFCLHYYYHFTSNAPAVTSRIISLQLP